MTRSPDAVHDELLVLSSQAHDVAAFEELLRRWSPRLRRHALHLVGRPDVAADVVQEAWLAIVRGLPRLDDPTRFGPWALSIVTRRCADWIRREARRRRLVAGLRREAAPPASPAPSPAADDLLAAVTTLPAEQRAVLGLFYAEDLGLAQISEALRIPVGTVKSRLHIARRTLRSLLGR